MVSFRAQQKLIKEKTEKEKIVEQKLDQKVIVDSYIDSIEKEK